MKYFTYVLSLLCSSLIVQGQSWYDFYNLKGKVKMTSETWFDYYSNSWTQGDIKNFNSSGNPITSSSDRTQESNFNAKTNELEIREYNFGRLEYQTTYIYDSKNKLTKSLYYWSLKDKFLAKSIYIYDSKNNLIRIERYNEDSLLTTIDSINYTYDLEGRIATKIAYGPSKSDTTYNYENGKLVRKVILRTNYETFMTDSYFYENEKLVRETQNQPGYNFTETIYNSNGDPAHVTGYWKTPADSFDIIYEYEYDSYGNWTKKNQMYPKTGKRGAYYKRTIIYY